MPTKREPPEKATLHSNLPHKVGELIDGYRVVSDETKDTDEYVYRLERVKRTRKETA